MVILTNKQYQRILSLEEKFYEGVDEYKEELLDSWSFEKHFEEIMKIINRAKQKYENV